MGNTKILKINRDARRVIYGPRSSKTQNQVHLNESIAFIQPLVYKTFISLSRVAVL